MAQKRQSQSIRSGRKAAPSLFIVITICIVALIGGGGSAIYAMMAFIDTATTSAGVTTVVNINGNDIVVEVVSGERLEHLQTICIIIEGYDLPPGLATARVIGKSKVIYPNFVIGIRGTHRIGIRGQFDDGREMLIYQQEFRFS